MWSHKDVVEARRLISPHITQTPLLWSETMSRPGAPVFVKAEALQRTGSFKVRGALNAVGRLDDKARARGVVTASTGSHGKGVAYAARAFGTSAVVVLPENPVEVKRKAIEEYGARTVEFPGTSVDRIRYARELAEAEGTPSTLPKSSSARAPSAWRSWNSCPTSTRSWSPSAGAASSPGFLSP